MNEITSEPENEAAMITGANNSTEGEQIRSETSEISSDEDVIPRANDTTEDENMEREMGEITLQSEKKEFIITRANIATEANKMQVLIAVNKLGEYPQVSPSSIDAFDWTLDTILSTEKKSHFAIMFVHVQVPKTRLQHYTSLFRSLMDACWGRARAAYRLVKSDADSVEKDAGSEEKLGQFQAYFEDRCKALEIECDWFHRIERYPEEAICGLVKSLGPDLLVLGHRRGLSDFQFRWLFEREISKCCAEIAECRTVRIKPEEVTREFLEAALLQVERDDTI